MLSNGLMWKNGKIIGLKFNSIHNDIYGIPSKIESQFFEMFNTWKGASPLYITGVFQHFQKQLKISYCWQMWQQWEINLLFDDLKI